MIEEVVPLLAIATAILLMVCISPTFPDEEPDDE